MTIFDWFKFYNNKHGDWSEFFFTPGVYFKKKFPGQKKMNDHKLVEDLVTQNKKLERRLKQMMEEKKQNEGLAARLAKMERLMCEVAAKDEENEKLKKNCSFWRKLQQALQQAMQTTQVQRKVLVAVRRAEDAHRTHEPNLPNPNPQQATHTQVHRKVRAVRHAWLRLLKRHHPVW